jgi:hypothetical protein
MRLLHLLQPLAPRPSWLGADPADRANPANHVSGEASLHALRAIIADGSMPAEHLVLCLGPSPARRFARAAGLAGIILASPPLGRAANAGPILRRALRRVGEIDALVGWGFATAPLLAKAPHHLRPRACILDPRTGTLTRAFGPSQQPSIDLPAPSTHAPSARAPAPTREHARSALAIAPHETVVVMLGDAASPPDAVALTLAAQSHAVAGRMLTLVLPACAARLDRALRHVHEMAYVHRVIVHDGPLAEVLPAGDVGVLAPADETPCPFACAMWYNLWRSAAPAPLVAPMGLLPAWATFHAARSARATDLAGGIFAALSAPAAPSVPSSAPASLPPGESLHRALQHLLALASAGVTA